MPKTIACPQCLTLLRVADTLAPQTQVKCPKCAAIFAVPADTLAPPQEQFAAAPILPPARSDVEITSGARSDFDEFDGGLCTLFCCWPFWIVAIVYAAQVNGKLHVGDVRGARPRKRPSDQRQVMMARHAEPLAAKCLFRRRLMASSPNVSWLALLSADSLNLMG